MIDYSSPATSIAFEGSHDDVPALPLWTFTLGILALLTFGLTSVPAIICGHRALAAARRPGSESLERYVAVTGLVIGYLGVALLALWITLLARFLAGH
jgi:Na+-translocating ferredoxin:NAD+ oxidoreductase RnfD subunit